MIIPINARNWNGCGKHAMESTGHSIERTLSILARYAEIEELILEQAIDMATDTIEYTGEPNAIPPYVLQVPVDEFSMDSDHLYDGNATSFMYDEDNYCNIYEGM